MKYPIRVGKYYVNLHIQCEKYECVIIFNRKNDEKVQEFMLKHNMSTIKQLGNYYFQNIFKITRKLKNVPVVWEEVFDDGYDLDHNVVVQVWKSNYSTTLPKVNVLFKN